MLTTERLQWYKDKLENAEIWDKNPLIHWCGMAIVQKGTPMGKSALMKLFDIMLEDSEKDDKERL